MEALHCGLRVQDELQNIAVNFFLFNGQKINTFSYADYYLVLIIDNNNKVYYHFPYLLKGKLRCRDFIATETLDNKIRLFKLRFPRLNLPKYIVPVTQ